MFEKFSNSWKLVKASASVLAADRELVIFPILSTIGVIIRHIDFCRAIIPVKLFRFSLHG